VGRRENFKVGAAGRSGQYGRAAGEADGEGAGIDRRDQRRRARHEDQIGVDAVFGENFFILREPERQRRVTNGRVTDGDFCRSLSAEGFVAFKASK